MKNYKKFLCLFVAFFIGFFTLCGPIIKAEETLVFGAENTNVASDTKTGNLKTSWRGGDLKKSLKLDWMPMIRDLAAGKVPGDKYTWDFEKTPLYLDKTDGGGSIAIEFVRCLNNTIANPTSLTRLTGETTIGLFSIGSLGLKMRTQKIKTNGKEVTRCALTEVRVESWRSPYGAACSRNQAMSYYKKCQKIIDKVVKKIMAARQKNGQPLTKAQKLKWIHDWLITSVDYDFKGLNARKSASALESSEKYRYLYNEYGALVDGKAVCEGYSYAFKAIVDELSRRTKTTIKCDVAIGNNHAWNLVQLNKKWYVIDVTWDDSAKKDFFKKISTSEFLVTDKKHGIRDYTTGSGAGPATSRKYEGAKWPRFKKALNECKVTLKYPNKVYTYKKGKKVVPEVVVKYGRNVIPKGAYKVVRTDNNKTGTATIKIVPSKSCTALKGSVKGPSFIIRASK